MYRVGCSVFPLMKWPSPSISFHWDNRDDSLRHIQEPVLRIESDKQGGDHATESHDADGTDHGAEKLDADGADHAAEGHDNDAAEHAAEKPKKEGEEHR